MNFVGFCQVFRLGSDISMRHRHADMDMQIWLGTCRWQCQRGCLWCWYVLLFQFCTFWDFVNYAFSRILTGFPISQWFWQVFLLVSDISMRHRHADIDMQIWLGTCRWECQRRFLWFCYVFPFAILHFLGFWQVFLFVSVFPRILTGFPIGKWYFYETSTCRHGYANMTWDL